MEQEPQPMLAASVRELLDSDPAKALAFWCENKDCTIDLENSLIGGHTKAKLAVVSLQDSRGARTAVLKHCPADPYLESRDFRAFQKASRSGPPGFADSHLVGLDEGMDDAPIPDWREGQFLVIKYLGPGPLRHYNTLAHLLESSALGSACKTIMPQILIEWNNEPNLPSHKREGISAQGFLLEILGMRCDLGGNLRRAIEDLTEREQELRWPLAAVTSGEGIDHVQMKGLRGNAHGDLHPDNVFIPMPNTGKSSDRDYGDFSLIDLTTFRGDRLLAVDPAHLIISITARVLAELSPQGRKRLKGFVLDPDGVDPASIPGQLTAAIKEIHDTGVKFAEERGYYKTWDLERLAAIAACALLFVGREKDDEQRMWFLQLATDALKRLRATSPDPPGGPAKGIGPTELHGTGKPAAGRSHEPTPENRDHHRPDLRLLQGGATLPSANSTDDDPAITCINLIDELIREIRDLSDHLSAGEAETATTTARVIAEELSEALDALHERPGVPSISDITSIAIARVSFDDVRADLEAMREHGINHSRLRTLYAKAEKLLRCMIEIGKVGNPDRSPRP